MIDNEFPVLRKEDLILILESLFKFSQEPNNAFVRKDDGLYVLDFYESFKKHIDDSGIHATNEQTSILDNFSINSDDILCYKGDPIVIKVSKTEKNAVVIKNDGLFIKDLSEDLQNHAENNEIHITNKERQTWNSILKLANEYTKKLVDNLVIYDYQIVPDLPTEESVINNTTIYLVKQTFEPSGEEFYVRYIRFENTWIPLDLTLKTYKLLALINDFVDKNDKRLHDHKNKEALDLISYDKQTNRLLLNGTDFLDVFQISNDPNNAVFLGSDNKLYVKDLSSELASLEKQSSLSKVVLLEQYCDSSGIYELEENIDNFNFIMVHYFLMPDEDDLEPYDAKTEMLDTDNLNFLYQHHIDYILEHDYGLSTFNTKIRFHENKMQILYYNHVCIYKIIGVR